MKVNGKMEKEKATEFFIMQTEVITKANGVKI